jgi:hypothetical protein
MGEAWTCPESVRVRDPHDHNKSKKPRNGGLSQAAELGIPGLTRQSRRTQDLQDMRWNPKVGTLECEISLPLWPCDSR